MASPRARARGCERETPRGPGRAVETTDGDHGRGSGRWSGSGSRRRGCRGCGGGLGPGRVPAEGRGPCQQVLGKPGYGVPAGFGASLAGQALQEGGSARARGDRGATRRGLVVAAGLASLGLPLPPPPRATRDNKGWLGSRHAPAGDCRHAAGRAFAGGSLEPTHSRGKPQLARFFCAEAAGAGQSRRACVSGLLLATLGM